MSGKSDRVHPTATAELLVGLVVVVLTAAIVLPIVANARGNARGSCLSNLGALGRTMLLYVADHDDHFPVSGLGAPGSSWGPALLAYRAHPRQYGCPEDPTQSPNRQAWALDASEPPTSIYSYALNANLPASDTLYSPRDRHRNDDRPTHARLSQPSSTVMFFEVQDAVGYLAAIPTSTEARSIAQTESPTGNTTGNPLDKRIPGGSRSQTFADGLNRNPHLLYVRYATGNVGGRVLNGGDGSLPRHSGRANYCLADGHAVSLAPEAVSGGADSVDSACDQGTTRGQAGRCAEQKRQNAAGTANKRFRVTFSTR